MTINLRSKMLRLGKQGFMRLFGFGAIILLAFQYVEGYFGASAFSDAGCFMAIGQRVLQHDLLYLNVWDNKAPGIFFIHALVQGISSNVYVDYPQWVTLGFLLISLSVILVIHKWKTPGLLWFITGLVFLFHWLKTWEVFYVGAYTEEWGMFLIIAALAIIVKPRNKLAYVVSGILFGYAVFIKEPFIFFVLPFWGYWFLQQKISFRSILYWHSSISIPWGAFLTIYVFKGHFSAIWMYWKSAFAYAGGDTVSWQKVCERLSKLHELTSTRWFGGESVQWIFTTLCLYLTIRVIWGVYRKMKYQEHFSNLPVVSLSWSALVASLLFLMLGPRFYFHYAIPFGFSVIFCFTVFLWDLGTLIRIPNNQTVGFVILSLFVANNYGSEIQIHREVVTQPDRGNAGMEAHMIQQKIPAGSSVFVDHEDGGRWYVYGHLSSWGKFPVPYYIYFYNPDDNHQPHLVANRDKFREDFLQSPPEFILTKSLTDSAQVFRFTQLVNRVNVNYECIDSLYSLSSLVNKGEAGQLYILKRKHEVL